MNIRFSKTLIILLITSILFGQAIHESELKCSRAKSAKKWLAKDSQLTSLQNNYDAIFYDINLKIDPTSEMVYGEVGVKGVSKVDTFDKLDLNLANILTVESVTNSSSEALVYSHNSNILSINFNTPLNKDQQFDVIIKYNGNPASSGSGYFDFDDYDQQPMIYSLSEPYGAREWWPCKDTPSDKADSVNISITVPEDLIAVSNGLLANTDTSGSMVTYHWEERYPIATYLVSIAIHPYRVFYDWYEYSPTDSMRLEYYVFSDHYEPVQENYALTKNMLAAMSSRFGEYPFIKEKYGHAEFVWGGGMEHQTLSSMGGYSEALIAHELAHQWWGDMVTCASFHHIWLNEGLANYSESLWYELRDNNIQSFHDDMASNKAWYGWRDGSIYVEDTTSVSRIFSGPLTYAKATWVVHMLRHIVGDENFFDGLKEYGERYRFKSAVTEDLQEVMEEVSDEDLEYFFQRWIYGEFYPIYDVVYGQDNETLLVKITQTQDSDVFEMPIDLKINFSDGSINNSILHNSLKEEYFKVHVGSKTVANIEIDPDNWILRKIESIRIDTLSNGGVLNDFILFPSYPNPFNSEVAIKFNLHKDAPITVKIFNLEGSNIWKYSENYNPGTHIVSWNGLDNTGNKVPTGTYFVEVSNDKTVKSNKILLLK